MIRIFQIAALLVLLQGCATVAEVGLLGPTDLSSLKPGMTVAEVHEILGEPDELESISDDRNQRFTYDRGYENPRSKEIPVIYYGLGMPLLAIYDSLNLGVLGECTLTCQEGWLELKYDRCGYLVAASEQIADDGGYCWTGRTENRCRTHIASHPKPTTLSESLSHIAFNDENIVSERCLAENEDKSD